MANRCVYFMGEMIWELVNKDDNLNEVLKIKLKKSKIQWQLQNVVSTFNCGCKLNTTALYYQLKNSTFHERMHPTLFYHLNYKFNRRCMLMIYANGKIISNSCKSEHDARRSAKIFCKKLRRCNYNDAKVLDFEIRNMVASADLGKEIDLGRFVLDHNCLYNPEQFCGARLRVTHLNATCLVYHTGKFVITGCNSPTHINDVYNYVYPLLYMYLKK